MADDNKQDPHPAFGLVTMHRLLEIPGRGERLIVGFRLQDPQGVPLSHLMEVPGEVLPVIIAALQKLVDQFPALTSDLCQVGPSRQMSVEELQGKPKLVDPAGQPLNGASKLKLVN